MGIAIDIGVIAIMVITIIIGYKRGLIKVAVSLIAIVAALVISIIVYKPLAKQIAAKTPIDDKIENVIYNKIKHIDFENLTEEEKSKNQILMFSEKYIDEALEKSKDNVAKYVAESLTESILEITTFICLFIALRIALIVLRLLSDMIGELPLIKQFNKSGGTIYGIIEGFMIVNLIFAILYVINPICLNGNIKRNIEKSQLGKAVYENNLIVNAIIK